jgi:hypothetical protein
MSIDQPPAISVLATGGPETISAYRSSQIFLNHPMTPREGRPFSRPAVRDRSIPADR